MLESFSQICFCNTVANIDYYFVIAPRLHYICRMGNIRKTKSLQTIIDAFSYSKTALSGVELIKRFQADMNKTTVYRILDRLEKQDVLHSFTDTNGLRWYAKSKVANALVEIDHHSHFQCQDCGMSKCLPIEINIPSVPNHRVDAASLILVGQCEDCLV